MSQNPAKHLKEYQFKPGQSGNPAGKPKGCRSKLTEDFLRDLHADFVEHGAQAIAEVREKDTSTYLRIVASLIPKEFTFTEGTGAIDRLLDSIPDSELPGFVEGVRLLAVAAREGGEKTITVEAGKQPVGVY